MNESQPAPEPSPEGTITKGVLLNVGLNLFICLIWIPLCGGSSYQGGTNLAGEIGVVFFLGGVFIGITQIVHVLPLAFWLHQQGQKATLTGVLRAAGVTFAIWLVLALAFAFVSW